VAAAPRLSTLPWHSALLCACAGGVSLSTRLSGWLVYDRSAVDQGQWWRLLSGSLVHFSPVHALMDLGAVLIAGSLLERRDYPYWWGLYLLAAAASGAAVQWLRPDLQGYGGLSGVAVALVAALCLEGSGEGGSWGLVCAGALALLLAKLAWEFAGGSLSAAAGEQAFVPVPQAHAAGLGAAVVLYACRAARGRRLCPELSAAAGTARPTGKPAAAGTAPGNTAAPRWNP
jgi:rhomboid family GlyGly-CTERM serine protease